MVLTSNACTTPFTNSNAYCYSSHLSLIDDYVRILYLMGYGGFQYYTTQGTSLCTPSAM